MRVSLWLMAALLVPGVALADGKIQPSTGIKLQALTDGAGNVCTTGAPCAILNSSGGGTTTLTPHNPDVATVTTGGTAVVAFAAGHTIKGGWISNPLTATTNLCISITGTAAGTAAADATGGTTCIGVGGTYQISPGPSSQTVSVNATDSVHPFSGMGYY